MAASGGVGLAATLYTLQRLRAEQGTFRLF
jgi:hypothetical protein